MNQLILSLGSNIDVEENISLCQKRLQSIFNTSIFSDTSITEPYGNRYTRNFLNQLVYIQTKLDFKEVTSTLKHLEREIGRQPTDKEAGIVKIDIDLIKWNEIIIRANEWNRSYITNLLPSLEKKMVDVLQNQK